MNKKQSDTTTNQKLLSQSDKNAVRDIAHSKYQNIDAVADLLVKETPISFNRAYAASVSAHNIADAHPNINFETALVQTAQYALDYNKGSKRSHEKYGYDLVDQGTFKTIAQEASN